MPGLDNTNQQPGYLLGRLMAVLVQLEAEAAGKDPLDTDMFGRYAVAVVNPAVVLNYATAHAKRPKANRYTRLVDDLVQRIGQPGVLTGNAEQQSLFTVGYHHQQAADNTTMTTSVVAEYLGHGSANAARAELGRLGVQAVGRDTKTGEKLWAVADVGKAAEERRGRGYRTDIHDQT